MLTCFVCGRFAWFNDTCTRTVVVEYSTHEGKK